MSKFIFSCPQCGNQFYAQEEWIGENTSCPNCGQSIRIEKRSKAMLSNHKGQISNEENTSSAIFLWIILGSIMGGCLLYKLAYSFCFCASLAPSVHLLIPITIVGAGGIGSVMYKIRTRFAIGMTMLAVIVSINFLEILFSFILSWQGILTPKQVNIYKIFNIGNWSVSLIIAWYVYFLAKKTKYHQVDSE